MNSAQIIISGLIICLILKTLITYLKKRNLPFGFFIGWLAFWLIGLFLVNNLTVLTKISKVFGIGRGVDLTIYLSIIIIFYLIYYLFSENYKLKKQLTDIIRHLAIEEYEKETRKK